MSWLVLGFSIYAVLSLVSMAAMSVGSGLLLACLLIGLSGPRGLFEAIREDWRGQPVYRAYFGLALALALACAVSLVVAAIWPLGYGGRFVEVRFARDMAKAWYLFWPLLLFTGLLRVTPGGRARILRAWLLAFGVLSVIGIAQYFTGWPRPQIIPSLPGRFHSTLFLGHHLSVASVFIFPFFAALDLGVRSNGSRLTGGLPRPLLLLLAAAGAVMLFGTYSRILWAALPLGLALWALLALPKRVAATVVAVLVLAGMGASQFSSVRERVTSVMGTSERFELWRANAEFVGARPLTGAGWHHNQELSGYYLEERKGGPGVFSGHAHNNLIEVLGGTGLLGLLAWVAWWAGILTWTFRAYRARPMKGFARGLLCAWFVFQLNGLTQVNFWESKVLHQVAWVTALVLLWNVKAAKKERHA